MMPLLNKVASCSGPREDVLRALGQLIESGVSPNLTRSERGEVQCLLGAAAAKNRRKVVRCLIRLKADVNGVRIIKRII